MKKRKLCGCGCGELANPGCKYIRNHHRRGKTFKLTEEQKAKQKKAISGKNHYNWDATKDRESHLCACGCREWTKPGNKYIHNHHMCGENNPMYGKLGKLCPTYGRKHTEETKEKISLSRVGEKNHRYDPTRDRDTKKCACGCGELTTPGKKYIQGHWAKTIHNLEVRCAIRQYCDSWYDPDYKEWIKHTRDFKKCQNPNCIPNNTEKLVHHINENKQDCRPYNLLTLCRSCHGIYHMAHTKVKRRFREMFKEIAKYNTDKCSDIADDM